MKLFSKEKKGNERIIHLGPFHFKYLKNKAVKKMRLGISYNIFDGEELLKPSLLNMRSHAEYISVVYQKISNHGQPADENLESLLKQLQSEGLIDELISYVPNLQKSPTINEREKRNIGLKDAAKNNCTHFMTMDADEFYYPDQLEKAKVFVIENNIDVTACMCYNYGTPRIRHRSPYLAGGLASIIKITRGRLFSDCFFPLLVDPTRKVEIKGKFYFFSPHELIMHHYTYVREDIMKKWLNSSSCSDKNYDEIYKKAAELRHILSSSYEEILANLTFPYCGGLKDGDIGVQPVEDYFNIQKYLESKGKSSK